MPETDEKKYVVLGMPGYGNTTHAAARGFFRSSNGGLRVQLCQNSGSLLAQNFNALWCGALTMAHRGKRVDYFAMQHDDIEPEDFWLDKLVEELEARDLDVLGVVAPIKDEKGMTSIALDDPDGDNFQFKCRLSMREIYSLPETFTAEDTGFPLLINTGLWVCRFGEWAKRVHFTINDRIRFDEKRDMFRAHVEPEDWNFSRQCNALGLRVGVTRKIHLVHAGRIGFANDHPWGREDFDREYLTESVLRNLPKAETVPAPDGAAVLLES